MATESTRVTVQLVILSLTRAVLGIFIWVGQSKGQANFGVVCVGQNFVWVGQHEFGYATAYPA